MALSLFKIEKIQSIFSRLPTESHRFIESSFTLV